MLRLITLVFLKQERKYITPGKEMKKENVMHHEENRSDKLDGIGYASN
jgi:hypothetical protein